jgi:hypothetical protein
VQVEDRRVLITSRRGDHRVHPFASRDALRLGPFPQDRV